jgi:nucleotide-binding universal stress UspA family protein
MATHALSDAVFERVAYRRIVVPIAGDDESEAGVALAAQLAPEHGAAITAVFVIEVPAELPLDAHMLAEESEARAALEKAHAIAASRGVRLSERIVRARARGEAIVAVAEDACADLVVMRAAPRERKRLFGHTADYVLRHAGCRVLVTAPPKA